MISSTTDSKNLLKESSNYYKDLQYLSLALVRFYTTNAVVNITVASGNETEESSMSETPATDLSRVEIIILSSKLLSHKK